MPQVATSIAASAGAGVCFLQADMAVSGVQFAYARMMPAGMRAAAPGRGSRALFQIGRAGLGGHFGKSLEKRLALPGLQAAEQSFAARPRAQQDAAVHPPPGRCEFKRDAAPVVPVYAAMDQAAGEQIGYGAAGLPLVEVEAMRDLLQGQRRIQREAADDPPFHQRDAEFARVTRGCAAAQDIGKGADVVGEEL